MGFSGSRKGVGWLYASVERRTIQLIAPWCGMHKSLLGFGYLTETTNPLHPTQIGGRLKKPAVDAALLLMSEVETSRRLKCKTTTLFLDSKGAFDHVAKN